jgi:hypothetical protein
MKHAFLPALLACVAVAAPCGAQRASMDLASATLAASSSAPGAEHARLAAPSATRSPAAARGHSPVLGAFGGALVGGAMSYLVSQLAWNDFDSKDNADLSGRRRVVIAGGSALGALGGALLSHRSPRQRVLAPGATAADLRSQLISPAEVRGSTAVNVYELVESLRPQWLRPRQANTRAELDPNPTTRAQAPRDRASAPGQWPTSERPQPKAETESRAERAEQESNPDARGGVRVYVERSLVGNVNALREILTSTVTSIEFLDTAAAGYRLGPGNPAGAIVVHITSSSR